jgi:hypothetical protein
LILASDPETLQQSLRGTGNVRPIQGATVAGFNHTAERVSFARLTRLLDHTGALPQGEDNAPAFFSHNIASLSDSFAALDSETFTETTVPATAQRPGSTHQTVLYQSRTQAR